MALPSATVTLAAAAPLWQPPALQTALLCAFLVAVAMLRQSWRRSQLDLHKVPSPPGWPILGHLPLYWREPDFSSMLLRLLEGSQRQRGVGSSGGNVAFIRVVMAHKQAVLVADPAAAAAILARSGPEAIPRKVPEYAAFDLATGLHGHHSILTEQDEEQWVAVRKALAPAYSAAAVREHYPTMLGAYITMARRIQAHLPRQQPADRAPPTNTDSVETEDGLTQAIRMISMQSDGGGRQARAGGSSADVQIDHLALAAAIELQALGLFKLPSSQLFDTLQVSHDLEDVISVVHHFPVQPWMPVLHALLPWAFKDAQRVRAARPRLAAAYEVLYRHTTKGVPHLPGDLSLGACLSRLRDPRTGTPAPPDRIRSEIGNQIMAPETAAHTLAWVLYCVATHPAVEEKLMKELTDIGLPCSGDLAHTAAILDALGPDGLQGLSYLGAVINEAMRMYPAGASASPRLTQKPTRVGPYMLPAGVMVFPCLYVLHNFSSLWDEPHTFKPERWLAPQNGADPALDPRSGAPRFLPFSAGPKACIGAALGLVSVRTGAALLLSTFRFRLAARMGTPAAVRAKTKLALTLKVEGGLWLQAELRRCPAVCC